MLSAQILAIQHPISATILYIRSKFMTTYPVKNKRKWLATLGTLLLLVIGAAILFYLATLGYTWTQGPAQVLLVFAAFILLSQWDFAFRLLKRWRGPLETLFPWLERLFIEEDRRLQNHALMDKMAQVLQYYGIATIEKEERKQMADSLPRVAEESERIANCATVLVKLLQPGKPYIFITVLELLYREYYNLDTKTVWHRVKKAGDDLDSLARVLMESVRLPQEVNLPYRGHDLHQLLKAFDDFSLSLIQAELRKLDQIWTLTARYYRFLAENGVTGWELTVPMLLAFITEHQSGLPANEQDLSLLDNVKLPLLKWVGEEALQAKYQQQTQSLRESFRLISLAVFLTRFEHDHPQFLAVVCRQAGELDEAVEIALAYLDFRADLDNTKGLDGKPFVSINYLVNHWQEKIDERRQSLKGFDTEIETLRETLLNGQWLTQLWQLLEKAYRSINEDLKAVRILTGQHQSLLESVRRVFKGLHTETIERFLESRRVHAYLLAFNSKKGTVANLIDCLTVRDYHTGARRAIYNLLPPDILRDQNGTWKYHFRPYTYNTRIGVVPTGWSSLEEFYEELQKDVKQLVKLKRRLVPTHNWTKNPLKDTEVILHRFGLRNHYRLKVGGDSDKATQNMKALFAARFDIDALIAVIGHEYENEQSLVEALLDVPIVLAIGGHFRLNAQEKRELDTEDNRIKLGLVHALGYMNRQSTSLEEMHRSIRQLGRDLSVAQDARLRGQAHDSLVQLFLTHISSLDGQTDRCALIAEAYLAVLVANAGISTLTEFIKHLPVYRVPVRAIPQRPVNDGQALDDQEVATHQEAAVPA
jgi:hypothetical protein